MNVKHTPPNFTKHVRIYLQGMIINICDAALTSLIRQYTLYTHYLLYIVQHVSVKPYKQPQLQNSSYMKYTDIQ